jgi:hypothetical protein
MTQNPSNIPVYGPLPPEPQSPGTPEITQQIPIKSELGSLPPSPPPNGKSPPPHGKLRPFNLTSYFRFILGATALVLVSIMCIAVVWFFFALVTFRMDLYNPAHELGFDGWARIIAEFNSIVTTDTDYQYPQSDHEQIYGWVVECMGAKTVYDLPLEISNTFTQPFERTSASRDKQMPIGVRLPFHPERAIITLSQALSYQRLALRNKADAAYKFWETTSIISITLGMFTTIIVSLSSTVFRGGERRINEIVRILAIVFPALGTAASAVIAFYGPLGVWTQASRTLASITQLHGQMAIGVWKLKCIEMDGDNNATAVTTALDDWSKRYIDIQTVSTATGGPTSAGGGSSGTGGKDTTDAAKP